MKKVFSAIFAAVLIAVIFPFNCFASVMSGTISDTAVDWKLDSGAKILTVSGSGAIDDRQKSYWFSYADYIETIKIDGSVSYLGAHAFSDLDKVKCVEINSNVRELGRFCFSNCNSLNKIILPDTLDTISDNSFIGCYSLSSFVVDGRNTFFTSENGALFTNDKKQLVRYNAGSDAKEYCVPAETEIINTYAFANSNNLQKVTVGTACSKICDSAFADTKIREIVIDSNDCTISEQSDIPADAKLFCHKGSATEKNLKSLGYGIDYIKDDIHIHNFKSTLHKPTCTADGYTEYYCNSCGFSKKSDYVNALGHSYIAVSSKAGFGKDGEISSKCSRCSIIKSYRKIYSVKQVKLSKTSYTYNGKCNTPAVTVCDSKGNKLKQNRDYKVTYIGGRKNVGKYTIKISLIGDYSGNKNMTYCIKPQTVSVSSINCKKLKLTVKIKKLPKQTDGFQVQYSTDKHFSKNTKKTEVKKKKSCSVSKLKKGKKYYVRVRSYKSVKGVKYYSSWSKSKSFKAK